MKCNISLLPIIFLKLEALQNWKSSHAGIINLILTTNLIVGSGVSKAFNARFRSPSHNLILSESAIIKDF